MRSLGIGALIATLISAMFHWHWHIMRNGAMLVGKHSGSFADDMRQMPRPIATFVWNPIRAVIYRSRTEKILAEAGEMEAAA